MCVAQIYDKGLKEIGQWLDGYRAAVQYPPSPERTSWLTIRRIK
jgi:hypothetical protein